MNKLTVSLTLAIVAILVASSAVLILYNDQNADPGHPPDPVPEEEVFEKTDRNVVVFSVDSIVEDLRSKLEKQTDSVYSFRNGAPESGDIVIIDEKWITYTDQPNFQQKVRDMLDNNIPLIFLNGDSYLYKDSGIELKASTDVTGCKSYGAYYSPHGHMSSYTYHGDVLEIAISKAYAWADSESSEDRTSVWSISSGLAAV